MIESLPGDEDPTVVTARLQSYREKCDAIVRSFALTEGASGGGAAGAEQKQQGAGADGTFQWDSAGMTEMVWSWGGRLGWSTGVGDW